MPLPSAAQLEGFARELLQAAGMPAPKADAVAQVLLEGDLMGRSTHGLALLPGYLEDMESGAMAVAGEPETVAQAPAALTWDGRRLPGPWLVLQALAAAAARARASGTCTVVVRRSHHIASLACYARLAAQQDLLLLLACSDPNGTTVAPFGGIDAVLAPNPVAAGIPCPGAPVVLDMATSATTNALARRLHREGGRLPTPSLLDPEGRPTDDPAVLYTQPAGAIRPLGGAEAGHKGFGLALVVEALTAGLAGHGRADPKEGRGCSFFLQVLDPRAFAGGDAFGRQMREVVQRCHDSRPQSPGDAVRVPGERALVLAREQRERGVALHPSIAPALRPWARKLSVPLPEGLS